MFQVLRCIFILINSDKSPTQQVMMIDDTARIAYVRMRQNCDRKC